MKFLNVNATIILKPVFEGDVLKAGTPLALDGSIANSDAAVGLVASDTAKGAESIAVVTEGTIDLTEVAASYGSALTDDCIAALKGITFLYGGKAVVPAGGSSLPDYSEASDGDVLAIEDGAPAWKEPSGGGGDGGVFVVNFTMTQDGDNLTATADKTYAEVTAAMAGGKICIANVGNMYYGFFYPFPMGTGAVEATALLFAASNGAAFLSTVTIFMADDESVQARIGQYTLTPAT